jgi:mutator protein MutT
MATVVGGILIRDGRILLGLRSPHRRFCPDCWDTIGGHVEAGETLEQALVRELGEEIGVVPSAWARLTHLTFADPEGLTDFTLYRIDAWSGEPSPCNHEHTELGWFTIDEACRLPNLASQQYLPVFDLLRG